MKDYIIYGCNYAGEKILEGTFQAPNSFIATKKFLNELSKVEVQEGDLYILKTEINNSDFILNKISFYLS